MIKNIILIIASILMAFFIVYFIKFTNGIFLTFGWTGMYLYLDKFGFPFLWNAKCPTNYEQFPVPTGCNDGFNLIVILLNILIFTIVLFIILKLVAYIISSRVIKKLFK